MVVQQVVVLQLGLDYVEVQVFSLFYSAPLFQQLAYLCLLDNVQIDLQILFLF